MKTSSVEFISRSPTPSPMELKYRRFVLLRKFSSLGSGSEGKREIVLNRRPELYRGKYRCVQLKINLLKKTFLCRFSPLVSMEIPLRTAYGQNGRYGMQPKSNAVFARRRIEMKLKLLDIRAEKERSSEGERERIATAGSDVVQSGRPIFDDFFQHLWPYIGNNTANVVFQIVKRLWLIRIHSTQTRKAASPLDRQSAILRPPLAKGI
ncbi:hypothetical protein TNCV_2891641 [Trichonephila clavipes]|nr:hypothetical protein TNCV_2891641 [Trichonephila clavipes]